MGGGQGILILRSNTGYYITTNAIRNTGGAHTLQQQRSLEVKQVLKNKSHESQLLMAQVI